MKLYRAALVHKSLREITPRRALDRANRSGQWHKLYIPMLPRRGFGYRTEAAAVAAMTRTVKKWPASMIDEWRGLVWMRGQESKDAITVAI